MISHSKRFTNAFWVACLAAFLLVGCSKKSVPPAAAIDQVRQQVESDVGTIWVIDNSPGVSPEVGGKLFQPFFTTKRSGLGMGLSICQSILDSLGGRIERKNHDGSGAVFSVALPLA